MKKQQQQPTIVIEWNSDAGVSQSGIEGLCEDDLLPLARALGRLAARRELTAARQDRARSATTSDEPSDKVPAKAHN